MEPSNWDTLLSLYRPLKLIYFSSLHQKVTKFPAPLHLKSRNESSQNETKIHETGISVGIYIDNETKSKLRYTYSFLISFICSLNDLESKMKIFQAEFTRCQSILRDLDLLIEAHKQLSLAIEEPVDNAELKWHSRNLL